MHLRLSRSHSLLIPKFPLSRRAWKSILHHCTLIANRYRTTSESHRLQLPPSLSSVIAFPLYKKKEKAPSTLSWMAPVTPFQLCASCQASRLPRHPVVNSRHCLRRCGRDVCTFRLLSVSKVFRSHNRPANPPESESAERF